MKKNILYAVTLSLCLFGVSGAAIARSADIYEPAARQWITASNMTALQLRERIVAAAQSLGWNVSKEEPGRLELLFDKQGKHQVLIAVTYDEKNYKMNYLNSVNMNFSDKDGSRKIHPNHNRWIKNLMKKID